MNRLALPSLVLTACLAAPTQGAASRTGGQDFVLLGETRPVLIRAHVEVDGKPLQAGWDRLLKDLFAYLDVNGDGALSKEEAARIPSVEQLLVGGIEVGGRRRAGKAGGLELKDLDTDKNGKVSPAELAAWYRKNGLAPFQFQLAPEEVDAVALAFLNGPNPEPSLEEVSKTVFTLLDGNGDGKLTQAELSAALDLLDRDENDDEILTARELVYSKGNAPSRSNPVVTALMRKGKAVLSSSGKVVVPITGSDDAGQGLVRLLQERYGASNAPTKEKKLDRKALGLDAAAFRQLDRNGDGVLDAAELAGFGKRAPDLELVLRLGDSDDAAAVEVVAPGGKRPLGDHLRQAPELALLELGLTRAEVRMSGEGYSNRLADLIQQQLVGQFDQADRDGNGILDAKEGDKSPVFRSLFKYIDRDGDGKVSKKDLVAYLHDSQRLQAQALAGCVSLVLVDQSRGLFDLLDDNRDGRLSVRELRQAARLLDSLDREKKGYLTTADIPRSYQLRLRRGPAQQGGLRQLSFFERYYGSSAGSDEARSARGPAWFRKMDRNRDGDVSRKEFLFGQEQFRKIDTDGDGLISVEEAEKAGTPR